MINLKEKLNFKLNIIFILSLWGFIFISILFFNYYLKNHFEKSILNSIENLSTEGSININNHIENKLNILTVIANNLSDEDLSDPENAVKKFNTVVDNNDFKKMSITTLDGTAYIHTGEIINVYDRDYFQKSLKGENFVSGIVSSKIDTKKANVYSVPIIRNNEIVGVLWASILTDVFAKYINLNTINELGNNLIIDSNGNLIVNQYDLISYSSIDDSFNFFNQNELKTKYNYNNLKLMKENFENLTNNYTTFKFDNSIIHIYYSKLNYNNWWLITLINNETINSSYNHIAIPSIILIVLISIVFLVMLNKENINNSKFKSLAYVDTITEGKNDIFLRDNISKIINKKDNFAFISLEIINIKNLVNIIGIKNTEFLLKEIYNYLYNMLSKDEIIVHSYFGEFKLILKYKSIKDFTKRIEKINFSNINENLVFKMGIYLVDISDSTFENMCSYVNIAKEALPINNSYMIYNKQLHKRELDKLRLEEDIKFGIENKEFKAWFQPKFGDDGKTIIGAEALVRWYKYDSIISPYIFIPICEANGLIKEIDELVFEDVCKNILKWICEGKKVVPISINLSRRYLNKVDFIDTLEKYILKYNIPKYLIQFEITESSLIENENKLKETIDILHKKGFKVLLDDFGVGYSSIKAISNVNFDTLKIDKSFIDGIGTEKLESIIKYTINLAHNLGMNVIAEGIETEDQYKFLLNCNCSMFQGYYFNKPMDSNSFSKLI